MRSLPLSSSFRERGGERGGGGITFSFCNGCFQHHPHQSFKGERQFRDSVNVSNSNLRATYRKELALSWDNHPPPPPPHISLPASLHPPPPPFTISPLTPRKSEKAASVFIQRGGGGGGGGSLNLLFLTAAFSTIHHSPSKLGGSSVILQM